MNLKEQKYTFIYEDKSYCKINKAGIHPIINNETRTDLLISDLFHDVIMKNNQVIGYTLLTKEMLVFYDTETKQKIVLERKSDVGIFDAKEIEANEAYLSKMNEYYEDGLKRTILMAYPDSKLEKYTFVNFKMNDTLACLVAEINEDKRIDGYEIFFKGNKGELVKGDVRKDLNRVIETKFYDVFTTEGEAFLLVLSKLDKKIIVYPN